MDQPAGSPLSWVIGAGGLLGTSVIPALAARGPMWSAGLSVPWATPTATDTLAAAATRFVYEADGGPWQIVWCAGAGVTGSTPADLAQEAAVFEGFLQHVAHLRPNPDGAVFLASSAGGVYAGSVGAPFTESVAAVPISPYGHAKIVLESSLQQFSELSGIAVLVGRISNLYGPNQNLGKAQGLISQMCRSHLLRQPLSIYVPLDTVRDYLFASDCGEMIADGLVRLRRETNASGPAAHLKILASQQGVTIGFLIAELRRIFKRSPRITYGSSATSKFQVRDLRMSSEKWPEIDRRELTPLPAGIKKTVDGLMRSLQRAQLA
jgi:UDP-glucose 4-epimerase